MKSFRDRVRERAYYIWQNRRQPTAQDDWILAWQEQCEIDYKNNPDRVSEILDLKLENVYSFKLAEDLAHTFCQELQSLIEYCQTHQLDFDFLLIAQTNIARIWRCGTYSFNRAIHIYYLDDYFSDEICDPHVKVNYDKLIRDMRAYLTPQLATLISDDETD